jgi:hypothetical protein
LGVEQECREDLRARASAASGAGNFTDPAVRLHVATLLAQGEAMVRILQAAGYESALGVNMADHYLWVKPGRRQM